MQIKIYVQSYARCQEFFEIYVWITDLQQNSLLNSKNVEVRTLVYTVYSDSAYQNQLKSHICNFLT